jgi:hypothetical protein
VPPVRSPRVAYLILAHRYPAQLARLVDRLDGPQATFVVHVDRKARATAAAARSALGGMPNVRFAPSRRSRWGTFGVVAATLAALRVALAADEHWEHVALLTGQDYPIKPNDAIVGHLAAHAGRSWVHLVPMPRPDLLGGGLDRVERWHLRRAGRHLAFPPLRDRGPLGVPLEPRPRPSRRVPGGLHPYSGAQFWVLSRPHAEHVLRFADDHASFVRYFRFVDIPDEIFFHTIIGNRLPRGEVVEDTLTFSAWDRPGALLDASDVEEMRSAPHLFGRKFDATVDPALLDLVDRELLGR